MLGSETLTCQVDGEKTRRRTPTRVQARAHDDRRLHPTAWHAHFRRVTVPDGAADWAGWTANASVHPAGPLIGIAISGFGTMLAFGSTQTFIGASAASISRSTRSVDASVPYAAAAVAAASLLRNVLGATLPLAAPSMWKTLGWGWGGSLLSLASIPILPVPLLMFRHGPAMRRRWPFVP